MDRAAGGTAAGRCIVNKYHRLRDTRRNVDGVTTGRRLSCSIEACSSEEADEIFEARWQQAGETELQKEQNSEHSAILSNQPPVITNDALREQFMAPLALEIKRNTPVFQ
jgi:hypothetical protein